MPWNFTLPGACGMQDRGDGPGADEGVVVVTHPVAGAARLGRLSDPLEYQSEVPLMLRWSL